MAKKTTKKVNSNELDGKEFFAAIAQIEQEKGIKPGYMMEKITQALLSAYRRDHEGVGDNLVIEANQETATVRLFLKKDVVETVDNPATEISLDEARIALPQAQLEDLKLVRNEWAKIVRSMGGGARSYLRDTVVEPGGEGCLTIVFMDPMNYDMGKRPTVIGELERYVEANFGRSIYFKTRLAGRGERLNTIYVTQEELEEKIHMDITYEDE